MVAFTERSCTPRFVATVATPGGQAGCQRGEDDLGRRRAVVLGGEDLRVVGVDGEGLAVRVLLAEPAEVGDGGAAVRALHPFARGLPLELGGLGRVRQRLAGAAQGFDVHAVVDGRGVGSRHVLSSLRAEDRCAAAVVTLLR